MRERAGWRVFHFEQTCFFASGAGCVMLNPSIGTFQNGLNFSMNRDSARGDPRQAGQVTQMHADQRPYRPRDFYPAAFHPPVLRYA